MSADDARARFAAATETHLTAPLGDGVELRHVDAATWHAAVDPLWAEADPGRTHVSFSDLIPADEREKGSDLDALMAGALSHRLLFVAGEEVVGGYWGIQEQYTRYYMVASVIRRSWQGRGLYRRLLPRVVSAARDAGFAEVYSRHRADNNAVLVPKLRAGFTIAGFDVSPRWGLLVHLRYYLREATAKMFRYRIDGSGADELRKAGLALP